MSGLEPSLFLLLKLFHNCAAIANVDMNQILIHSIKKWIKFLHFQSWGIFPPSFFLLSPLLQPKLRITWFFFQTKWFINTSRLISTMIYARESKWGACKFAGLYFWWFLFVHASAAFIASNSFNFISHLISGCMIFCHFQFFPLPTKLNWIKLILNSVRLHFSHFAMESIRSVLEKNYCSNSDDDESLIDGKIIQLVNLSYHRVYCIYGSFNFFSHKIECLARFYAVLVDFVLKITNSDVNGI